jgi:hypothetical protein
MMIKLSGLAQGLNIKGQGHVMWAARNMEGMLWVILVPAYHVPGCKIRLLSTSSLLQTYTGEQIILDDVKLTLSGESSDPAYSSCHHCYDRLQQSTHFTIIQPK